MRMVIVAAGESPASLPAHAIVCHDVRYAQQRSEVLVRKGTSLASDEIGPLLANGVIELHVAVPDQGDVGEDAAAARLAAAVAGSAVEPGEAHFGQVTFTSTSRGMVRINPTRLNEVNAHDDVLLLAAEPDRPVDVGDSLGVVKCAPLFLPESTLRAVEALVIKGGPVLRVEAFRPMLVALVAPRERLRGSAFDRARTTLSLALKWVWLDTGCGHRRRGDRAWHGDGVSPGARRWS